MKTTNVPPQRLVLAIPMCTQCGAYRVGLLRRLWIRLSWHLWPTGRLMNE